MQDNCSGAFETAGEGERVGEGSVIEEGALRLPAIPVNSIATMVLASRSTVQAGRCGVTRSLLVKRSKTAGKIQTLTERMKQQCV